MKEEFIKKLNNKEYTSNERYASYSGTANVRLFFRFLICLECSYKAITENSRWKKNIIH